MRENVAQVMATEKRLAREIEAQSAKLTEFDKKIKAAIRTGHDDIAALAQRFWEDEGRPTERPKSTGDALNESCAVETQTEALPSCPANAKMWLR